MLKQVIVIVLFLIFSCISCENNSPTLNTIPTIIPSPEFQQWVSTIPPVEELQEWWKIQEKEWIFVWWDDYRPDPNAPFLNWNLHKNDTPEEIWRSKLINCHRATILFQSIYGGTYIYITQNAYYADSQLLSLQNGNYWIITPNLVQDLKTDNFNTALNKIKEIFHATTIQVGLPDSIKKNN